MYVDLSQLTLIELIRLKHAIDLEILTRYVFPILLVIVVAMIICYIVSVKN